MITGLGYAGFGSSALEDWRQFGTNLVGFQAVERGNSLLAFRMDDRKQRVVIDRTISDGARSSAGRSPMARPSMRSQQSWRARVSRSRPSRRRARMHAGFAR